MPGGSLNQIDTHTLDKKNAKIHVHFLEMNISNAGQNSKFVYALHYTTYK